jgi:tetratricopeptide (TPR) repeat protein
MLAAVDGRFEEAAQLHDDALTATRSLGDRDASARVLNNLGASAERMGWLERAERCFTDAIELADRLEDNALAGIARVNLAEVLRRQGALGRSRRTLAEAFDRLESSPTVPPQACQVRADLELSCGRTEEAAAWFERAATAWDALGRRDAKMARWMADLAGGAPLETLHAAVDGLPLPAQRDLARLELAMRCNDTATLDALLGALAEPSAAPSALLRAKLAPQSPEAATQVASLPATGPLPAAALRLLAACADHLPQASERLDGALDAATEGLLPSQAEALRGSVVTLRRRPCPAPR